jgi:DNA-binding transcriptional regulator WhiA
MTLKELSEKLKISRSGANHRLKRIIDIAGKINN